MRAENRCYLFDAGEPVSRALMKAGVDFNEIDRLFLSHLHADHCGGLAQLLQSMQLAKRKKLLPIHLPAEGVEYVELMRRTMYLFDEVFPYRVELVPWKAGQAIEDGGNRIVPFPTTHLKHYPKQVGPKYKQAFEAFALRVETATGRSVVYSGDLGKPEDLATALLPQTDLLIHECAHFPASSVFNFLKPQPVGRVVVTHFAPPEQRAAAVKLGKEMMGEKVSFSQDGMEVAL